MISSNHVTPTPTTTLISPHPQFFDWNIVYVWYCDGSSYTGNMLDEVTYTDDQGTTTTLYYRGSHIIDSVITTLNVNHGMDAATDIVLTGSSAGGLGAIHSCDRVSYLVTADVFRCVPDAAFFFNIDDFSGAEGRWATKWKDMAETHSSSGRLNADCLANMPTEYEWACVLADHALKYINTTTFLIQSAMDIWQLEYNYFSTNLDESETQAGHDCIFSPLRKCTSATFAGVQDFREQVLEHVKTVAAENDKVWCFK